jgi:uncharacterized protein (DUF924 family)
MDPRVDDVLVTWFGIDPVPSPAIVARWYRKDPGFDAEIRTRFGELYEEAARGALDAWRSAARSEAALLVTLDQFPRNMFRDDPRAFATDPKALELARDLLASGRARELTWHQRVVALLPFQHAEDRGAQAEGVAAYEALVAEATAADAPPAAIETVAQSLDYAKRHQVVIDRFGRFPHRNRVLGRASTAEETEFLKQPGSSF